MAAVGVLQSFIGVDAEHPVAGRLFEADVSGLGEVVVPGMVKQAGAAAQRYLDRGVPRPGVDNDDLVGHAADRHEALFENRSFITDDEGGSE